MFSVDAQGACLTQTAAAWTTTGRPTAAALDHASALTAFVYDMLSRLGARAPRAELKLGCYSAADDHEAELVLDPEQQGADDILLAHWPPQEPRLHGEDLKRWNFGSLGNLSRSAVMVVVNERGGS